MILSFIIVNYNTKLITTNCINSINNNISLNGIEYEIIVVDNNSDDRSVEFFEEQGFKHTKIIKNTKNDGFGKANNLGVKNSSGELLVLINSDTIAKNTDFLLLCNNVKKLDNVGVLSVKILNEDCTIQSVGFDFPSLLGEMKLNFLFWNYNFIKRFRYKNYKNKHILKTDWVSGCFMIIRKDDYNLVDGFDENIFMYAEDLDLCYRLAQHGKYCFIVDDTSIFHLHGKSSDKKYIKLNKVLENKKYYYYVLKKNNIFSEWELSAVKFIFFIHAICLVSAKKILNSKKGR